MILKSILDLSQCINKYRQDMYELARNKGLSDPDVIKVSQKLDEEIIKLQKIICEIRSLPIGINSYQAYSSEHVSIHSDYLTK
ncbi:MAG: aspartyl-phosphate phosphatase Spo0E family protein [Bacillota bacterium]